LSYPQNPGRISKWACFKILKVLQIMKWNEDRPFSRYLRYPKSLKVLQIGCPQDTQTYPQIPEGSQDMPLSRYPKSWKVLNLGPSHGTSKPGRLPR